MTGRFLATKQGSLPDILQADWKYRYAPEQ
jgi:hypothetical protein